MRSLSPLPSILIVWSLAGIGCLAAPGVTNLTASQRSGTLLVDIGYDLSAFVSHCAVRLEVSTDSGVTWTIPALTATGDIGEPVSVGSGKAIVWNAGVDWAGRFSDQVRFRVIANDVLTPGFSFIPSGNFVMGRTSGDTEVEAPPVTVSLSSFYLAQTETTKAQWDEVRTWAISNGYIDLPTGAGKASTHPVQMVSWWDAVKWCNARSEKEGLLPCYKSDSGVLRSGTFLTSVDWTANGYRLPTEAEWEKAARGSVEGVRFPNGSDFVSHDNANYLATGTAFGNLSGEAGPHPLYTTGAEPYTSPAGSFPGNAYGLKDMSGNIWEWCWDWYSDTYYSSIGTTINPKGPATATARVRRGGSWVNGAQWLRSSARATATPTGRTQYIGFRVACITTPLPIGAGFIATTTANATIDTLSDNAFLSSLNLNGAALTPSFSAVVAAYNASVSNPVSSTRLTAFRMEPNAALHYRLNAGNFAPLTSGIATGLLPLAHGDNMIEVRVTAQDGRTTRTYSILVNRGKAEQFIDFPPIEDRFIGDEYSLSATGGGSTSPVVFTVSSGPAMINGGILTFTGPGTVKVIASQEGDATHYPASAVVMTFRVVAPRPDVAAGVAASSLTGSEVYDPEPQVVGITSNKALPVTGIFTIANRAVLPDRRAEAGFKVQGAGGGIYFQVLYLGSEGNITAGLLSGTHETPLLDHSDEAIPFRMIVTPNKKKLSKKKGKRVVTLRKSQRFSVRATSTAHASSSDEAAIVVGTR